MNARQECARMVEGLFRCGACSVIEPLRAKWANCCGEGEQCPIRVFSLKCGKRVFVNAGAGFMRVCSPLGLIIPGLFGHPRTWKAASHISAVFGSNEIGAYL